MRLRIVTWLTLFLTVIIVVASLSLYYYFQQSVEDELELLLSNWTDDILVEIAKDPALFKKDPGHFVIPPSKSEFAAGNIFVEIVDLNGKPLAKSANLKVQSIPFTKGEDGVFSLLEMTDGTRLSVYQRVIEQDEGRLGYILVGWPTSLISGNFAKLRQIMVVVMVITLVALVLGLSIFATLLVVYNQRKFLSFASHELRTPLAIISGHAEVALRQPLSVTEYQETLKMIKEESDWMNRLVANMLLVFRRWSGTERLRKQPVNFSELVVEEASAIKTRFPAKKILLQIDSEADLLGDPDQLKKLVGNLLENAARYTKDDGRIEIKLYHQERRLFLEVADDGPGIKKELQKKIFNRFYRIGQGEEKGVGLGLAIVKWVVDSHRGSIRVESEEGKGARFIVALPRSGPGR